jgi:hypothetical protein
MVWHRCGTGVSIDDRDGHAKAVTDVPKP